MIHNPEMTFVQPSDREMARLGRIMAEKLNRSRGSTVVMIPMAGFSYPSYKGRCFHNPAGTAAFVQSLQAHIESGVPVRLLPMHINDGPFATAVVKEFSQLMERRLGRHQPRKDKAAAV